MLKVPTIKGLECVDQITQKLLRFRGVDHLIVDINSKTVRLIYDKNRTTLDAVKQQFRAIGHDAINNSEEPPEEDTSVLYQSDL